jgi:hypothetical protein
MASESCKVLVLADLEYYGIRTETNRCWGMNRVFTNPSHMKEIFRRPLEVTYRGSSPNLVDLCPLTLVQFNRND